ncbi:MAG: type II toxin-antitoxin system VapC family toxin [Candidatus Xenobiia bacterium LiM19]
MKIYIETSAVIYLLADNEPYKKERTTEMYEQLNSPDAHLIISEIVGSEMIHAPMVLSKCIAAIMEKKKIQRVPIEESHVQLALRFIENAIVPSGGIIEAIHLAAAFKESCDLFISWDFEYLYKGEVLLKLKELISQWALYPMTIGNPEMFLRGGFGMPKTLENLRGLRSQLAAAKDIINTQNSLEIIKKLGESQ